MLDCQAESFYSCWEENFRASFFAFLQHSKKVSLPEETIFWLHRATEGTLEKVTRRLLTDNIIMMQR
jgi:hypothetical protein